MRTSARPLALVAAATCLLTGVSACSSSSSAKPASTSQLQKIVLQKSDLPAGFTGKASTPQSQGSTDAQLASCTGVGGVKESDQVHDVSGEDFEQGQLSYSSDAQTYKNQSAVDDRVKILKSPKINTCLNTLFKTMLGKELPSGTAIDSSTIKVAQGSGGGPKNVVAVASGSIGVSAPGQKVTINLYSAFITGPLVTGTVTVTNTNAPIDSKTRDAAVAAVAKRANNP